MTNIYHLTCHVGQEFGSSLVGGFWLLVLPQVPLGCRLGLHHLIAGGDTSTMAPSMAFGRRPQFLSKWTSPLGRLSVQEGSHSALCRLFLKATTLLLFVRNKSLSPARPTQGVEHDVPLERRSVKEFVDILQPPQMSS